MIFDIENSLRKSNFRTLRRAAKARQSIPGWLILRALLKNGVDEGITSDPHDTTAYQLFFSCLHSKMAWFLPKGSNRVFMLQDF